jgi:hypothetical protein
VLLEERTVLRRVEPWVFCGVAANEQALIGIRASKEDARVAVERTKVNVLDRAASFAIEQPQRDVVRVVDKSGRAAGEREEHLVGWCSGGHVCVLVVYSGSEGFIVLTIIFGLVCL